MSVEAVRQLAKGRVYTGKQALEVCVTLCVDRSNLAVGGRVGARGGRR